MKRELHETSVLNDNEVLIEPFFSNDLYSLKIDLLTFKQNSKTISNEIVVHHIIPTERISKIDRTYLAIICLILKEQTQIFPFYGTIIYGNSQKSSKIELKKYFKNASSVLNNIHKTLKKERIEFCLNRHCDICKFKIKCFKELSEKDHLSLLRGFSYKQIYKLNNKGIFTVNQLSYTFRPKKRKVQPNRLEYPLKALAIREKKVFIKEVPVLPINNISVFLDIEALDDENFYYLFGVIIVGTDLYKDYSFWSNSPCDVKENFCKLIDLIEPFKNFTLFHYGNYEIQALRKIGRLYENQYSTQIERLISNSFNVLSIFSSHIYPPTYSNSLKEIAQYIGFRWTKDSASGLQSILWRKKWELLKNDEYKDILIQYNKEDCVALKMVVDWILQINDLQNKDEKISNISDIKTETYLKWGKQKFFTTEFKEINKFSYFDYQRKKVFFRTNKIIKKAIRAKSKKNNTVNKILDEIPIKCPKCNHGYFNSYDYKKSIVIDIKFMKNGIKRWIVKLPSDSFECCNCNYTFKFHKYGRNLMIWTINQYVKYLTSIPKIQSMLSEYLNLYVPEQVLYNFKPNIASEYFEVYDEIKNSILEGYLIHADETKCKVMDNSNSYVWVFTNMDSVFYMYRPNREAKFLVAMLNDFKGVLVSDYYSGYYSLKCSQQKCLIHLIRDLNNDMLNNQINEEFKTLVVDFGSLLKRIVNTIDKHGLKKAFLIKHKNEIEQFFDKIIGTEYDTELAIAYQKRFKRNRNCLFTFIDYDNIPWNNNNVENAIKPLAKYRAETKGILREKGLKDYLIILSIQQTCKYRGVNFLEFLKSKSKSINAFSKYP